MERRLIVAEDSPSFAGAGRTRQLVSERFVTYYGMPLIAKGQALGVLELFHRSPHAAGTEWVEFLESLANQAAIAVYNVGLLDRLQRTNDELNGAYEASLEGWARSLDLRGREAEGHTQQITDLALRLAVALGVPEDELVHIRRGALLHDVGNLGIPERVLLKPGPLDPDEWRLVQRHPFYANELLAPIQSLRPALPIPYCHHEKWDGTGYPRQLQGAAIPLAARLFAVVDVWDALQSPRPYRPAWTPEQAAQYLRDNAGKHFDPQIVETFLPLVHP
jgi:HD-GYP domain-containing protein (c-di-GMP phosphodiesterase class II)